MKVIKKIMLTLGSMVLFSNCFAIVAIPYGWYIEGNGGYSKISGANFSGLPGINGSGWWGYNVNGGYKFMPFFAAEIGYTRYANVTVTQKTPFAKYNNLTIKQYSYDAAAKGILPITCTPVELFAKLGWAGTNSSTSGSRSQTGSNVFFGIGGGYNFMPNAAAVLQWQRAVGNNNTGRSDLYSLGANYIFG